MLRELNELEYLCYAVGQPFNVAAMLSIKGSLSINSIKTTLKKLQKKHPLLKARISFDENKHPWFTSENVKEIPIKVLERKNDSQALNEFDQQLLTAFDLSNKELPLFRVVIFSSPEKSDLIFCSMHIISDGFSMTFFVVDFIRYIINPEEAIIPLDIPQQNIDIFTPKVRKMIPKTKAFSYLVHFFLSSYNFFRYAFLGKVKNPKINLKQNEIEVFSWIFNSIQTKQFFDRCKKEKVTIHSALCTAFLPSFSTIATSVNLRERLEQPIGKSFGFYSSAIVLNKRYKKALSFWENARIFQKTLNRNLRNRIVFLPLKLFNKKAPYNLLRKIGALYVGIATKKQAFAINNLGSLDKYIQEVNLTKFPPIDAFYGGITSFMNSLIILVYTLNEQLHFHYHIPKQKYDSSLIKIQSENAINRLLNALSLK